MAQSHRTSVRTESQKPGRGRAERDNFSHTSWLLVGAIGFEPMTSTV